MVSVSLYLTEPEFAICHKTSSTKRMDKFRWFFLEKYSAMFFHKPCPNKPRNLPELQYVCYFSAL